MAKIVRILFITAVCLMLTGCASSFSADNMMKPPRADGDGGEIQQAMTDSLGEQISLRFPLRGENRSAVVRADIDADGREEALAFYRLASENSGAHMILLDKDAKDNWKVIGEKNGGGGEIDRILFGDINGDGVTDIITGWSFFSGTNCIITASTFEGGELKEIPVYQISNTGEQNSALYTEMVTGDFDGDGTDEILTVYLNKQAVKAEVNLFKLQKSKETSEYMASAYSTQLDGNVVRYIGAKAGGITETIYGLVIDGYHADGRFCTEIVYWNRSTTQLVTPLNDPNTKNARFMRTLSTASEDINDDGIIELPSDEIMPGYEPSDSGALYMTSWKCYLSGGLTQEVAAMLVCKERGYALILRDTWRGRITAKLSDLSDEGNVLYIYEASENGSFDTEIMRIKAFSPDEWDDESSWEPLDILHSDRTGYEELCSNDYYTYAVLVSHPYSDSERYPQYTVQAVRDAFVMI